MAIPRFDDLLEDSRIKELLDDPESTAAKALGALPEKRRALVLATLANPTASVSEIATKAGIKPQSAESMYRKVQGSAGPILFQLGITEADLFRTVWDCLHATHDNIIRKTKYDDEGKPSGTEVAIVPTPDYTTRLKAATTLLQLGNYFPARKIDINSKSERRHTHELSPEAADMLLKREQHQKAIEAQYTVDDDGK